MAPCVSIRCGSASRHMRKVPVRLTARIWFQASRQNSWVRPDRSMPAMLASPSRRPKASTAVSMVLAASASRLMSATWVMHSPPPAADLVGRLERVGQALGVDVRGQHLGAFAGQADRGGLPDARGGSGDDDDTV